MQAEEQEAVIQLLKLSELREQEVVAQAHLRVMEQMEPQTLEAEGVVVRTVQVPTEAMEGQESSLSLLPLEPSAPPEAPTQQQEVMTFGHLPQAGPLR